MHRFMHRLRYAISVFVLIVLAAPCALGAAMGPVLRELGAVSAHVCKCGMKPGTCGCPECEKAERERLADSTPNPVPVLKTHCDDDAPAMRLGAPLPSGIVAAGLDLVPPPAIGRMPVPPTTPGVSSPESEPPTPPPRLATV